MPTRNFTQTLSIGNWIIIISLAFILGIQHINHYLEGKDVDSRVEAKDLIRATLSIQKMLDDSSNAIRLYIATNDIKYKKIFKKLSNIRMHKRAWPLEYHYYYSALDANINFVANRSSVYQMVDYYINLFISAE